MTTNKSPAIAGNIRVKIISLLEGTAGGDHLTLTLDLPSAEFPFDVPCETSLRAGSGLGITWIRRHFPDFRFAYQRGYVRFFTFDGVTDYTTG